MKTSELTRKSVIDFLTTTNHPMFVAINEKHPDVATTLAIGGALTMVALLVELDNFLTPEQLDTMVIISAQLTGQSVEIQA